MSTARISPFVIQIYTLDAIGKNLRTLWNRGCGRKFVIDQFWKYMLCILSSGLCPLIYCKVSIMTSTKYQRCTVQFSYTSSIGKLMPWSRAAAGAWTLAHVFDGGRKRSTRGTPAQTGNPGRCHPHCHCDRRHGKFSRERVIKKNNGSVNAP